MNNNTKKTMSKKEEKEYNALKKIKFIRTPEAIELQKKAIEEYIRTHSNLSKEGIKNYKDKQNRKYEYKKKEAQKEILHKEYLINTLQNLFNLSNIKKLLESINTKKYKEICFDIKTVILENIYYLNNMKTLNLKKIKDISHDNIILTNMLGKSCYRDNYDFSGIKFYNKKNKFINKNIIYGNDSDSDSD